MHQYQTRESGKSTKEFKGMGEPEDKFDILNLWSTNRTDHVLDRGHAVVWDWLVVKAHTYDHISPVMASVHSFYFSYKNHSIRHHSHHTKRDGLKRFLNGFHFARFYTSYGMCISSRSRSLFNSFAFCLLSICLCQIFLFLIIASSSSMCRWNQTHTLAHPPCITNYRTCSM